MKMPDDEIKAIVVETLAEQNRLQQANIDAIVLRTVASVLASIGIEDDDRKEFVSSMRLMMTLPTPCLICIS